MHQRIKKFTEFYLIENIDNILVDQKEIKIGKFDNELTDKEFYDLGQWSGNKRLNQDEMNKLNLYFGIYKDVYNNYPFKVNFGGFGRERIEYQGVIIKYDNSVKNPNNGVYFIIQGSISVKMGNDKGGRNTILKFQNVDEVINFFKTFEENIEIYFNESQ